MARGGGDVVANLFIARVLLIQAKAPPMLSLLNLFDAARSIH
jgi:hypothetical protein